MRSRDPVLFIMPCGIDSEEMCMMVRDRLDERERERESRMEGRIG